MRARHVSALRVCVCENGSVNSVCGESRDQRRRVAAELDRVGTERSESLCAAACTVERERQRERERLETESLVAHVLGERRGESPVCISAEP